MQHSLKGLMARNRWILSVAVFLLTVVALVSEVEARKIRVGIASVGIPAILYLINRENGYYQQEGLDVEIIVMESTLANAGVIAGDLDFSTIPVAGTIAALRGAPLLNVFASYDRPQHAWSSEDTETNSFTIFFGARPAAVLWPGDHSIHRSRVATKGVETHCLRCLGLTPKARRYFQLRNPG